MSKRLFILLILSIFLFSGCSQSNTSQGLLESSYFEELDEIVFYKDINYKKISKSKNLDEIVSSLKKVTGKKLDSSMIKKTNFSDTSLKLEFRYNDDGKKNKYISFKGNKMFYENNWYQININVEKLYNNVSVIESIDNNRKMAQLKREARKKLTNETALIGKWKYDYTGNITIIEFTNNNILIQEGRKFKYKINYSTDNKIHLTVYGTQGLFIKGNELFDMYILLDENNVNMKLKKTVEGNEITYENNLIFVGEIDGNELELGNFESFFFIKNSEE